MKLSLKKRDLSFNEMMAEMNKITIKDKLGIYKYKIQRTTYDIKKTLTQPIRTRLYKMSNAYKNDYTNYESYKGKTFENKMSEFNADENYHESWQDVDKLQAKFGEVYLVTVNYRGNRTEPVPTRLAKDEIKRYTFAFDHAIANTTPASLQKLNEAIMNYRKLGDKEEWTSHRAWELLKKVDKEIYKHPHTTAHFS